MLNRLRAVPIEKAKGDEDWEDLVNGIADRLAPGIAEAFIAACRNAATEMDVAALAQAIAAGDIGAVYAAAGMAAEVPTTGLGGLVSQVGTNPFLRSLAAPLATAALAGGEVANAAFVVASAAGKVMTASLTMDAANPRVAAFLDAYPVPLVKQVTLETKAAIAKAVQIGVANGIGPATTALEVRAVVGFGLTAQQVQAVENYKAELLSREAGAMKRLLRDKRFDKSVAAHLSGKTTLTSDQIDKMVARYRARLLKHRAETIARTESLRAANAGAHASMVAAAEKGTIPAAGIVRKWVVAKDERTCPVCRPIPKMNKEGVGLMVPFATPTGPLLLPPRHPRCRCTVTYRLTKESILSAGPVFPSPYSG